MRLFIILALSIALTACAAQYPSQYPAQQGPLAETTRTEGTSTRAPADLVTCVSDVWKSFGGANFITREEPPPPGMIGIQLKANIALIGVLHIRPYGGGSAYRAYWFPRTTSENIRSMHDTYLGTCS